MEINEHEAFILLSLFKYLELTKNSLTHEQLTILANEIPMVDILASFALNKKLQAFVSTYPHLLENWINSKGQIKGD